MTALSEAGFRSRNERGEVMHRQPGVDDLFDEHDVATLDVGVEILEEAHLVVAARLGGAVARQLDEVERVEDRHRARQVARERDAGLQRADEERLASFVVARQLGAQLLDAGSELVPVEEDFADAVVV